MSFSKSFRDKKRVPNSASISIVQPLPLSSRKTDATIGTTKYKFLTNIRIRFRYIRIIS